MARSTIERTPVKRLTPPPHPATTTHPHPRHPVGHATSHSSPHPKPLEPNGHGGAAAQLPAAHQRLPAAPDPGSTFCIPSPLRPLLRANSIKVGAIDVSCDDKLPLLRAFMSWVHYGLRNCQCEMCCPRSLGCCPSFSFNAAAAAACLCIWRRHFHKVLTARSDLAIRARAWLSWMHYPLAPPPRPDGPVGTWPPKRRRGHAGLGARCTRTSVQAMRSCALI